MPTSLCRKIWQTKQWPREWLQSLVVALLKEGNSQKSENYQTICLICQVSKVMLKVLQRLPTAAADEILAEEEAVGVIFHNGWCPPGLYAFHLYLSRPDNKQSVLK